MQPLNAGPHDVRQIQCQSDTKLEAKVTQGYSPLSKDKQRTESGALEENITHVPKLTARGDAFIY